MITTKKASTKKPVVKSNRVQVSGYVLMKDPKDQELIKALKARISEINFTNANLNREVKQLRTQINKLRGFEWMQREASELMHELNLLGNRTIKNMIYDWPDSSSQLAKFAKAGREAK